MTLSRHHLVTFAAVASSALAAGGLASAATKTTTKSATSRTASGATGATGDHDGHRGGPANEPPLTGDALKSASDAAVAANPGATADRAAKEDPAEAGSAAYEVKITKADGTRAEVLEDSSFKVLSTKADTGRGGRGKGDHGPGANANEKALTGDDLTQATDAAEGAVSGGTVERATTEDPAEGTGAAYEVHVEGADGSHVSVLLDSAFKVTKTVADEHGPGGHGHR